MQELIKYLEAIHPLSDGCKKYFENKIKSRHIKKGQHLEKAGLPDGCAFYVLKGLLRTYYRNADGKEIGIRFLKDKEYAIIIASLFDRNAGYELIQALEPTDISYLTHQEERYLFNHFPEYNYVGRVLLEQFLGKIALPKIYLCNLPAALQRYTFLMSWQPDLINRVPSKYLASYLGMTESTFSRIRSNRIPLKKVRDSLK